MQLTGSNRDGADDDDDDDDETTPGKCLRLPKDSGSRVIRQLYINKQQP